MIDPKKIIKLINRFLQLITILNGNPDLVLHKKIDQFYYMQKMEELKILLERFQETSAKLNSIMHLIDENYVMGFTQWQADIRWLNSYHRTQ